MAAQKRKAGSTRNIVIFMAVVLLGGGLLWTTGNLENPFGVVPNIANLITNGYQPKGATSQSANTGAAQAVSKGANADGNQGNPQGSKGANQANGAIANGPEGVRDAASQSTAAQPQQRNGGKNRNENEMQWNQFGKVLFNFWYLAATTAVLIGLGQLVSFIARVSKKFRALSQPTIARS